MHNVPVPIVKIVSGTYCRHSL